VPQPAPWLGEHGRQVLEELGYDAARIESLTAGGAVHLPR
jgi:crotonobetainyl-CoA:carnitine CoA-transferase CaiB-like acyl-CoA transferase